MQPSMRYHCAKLSQLVHKKKIYNLHASSVDKIMNKNSNDFIKRSMLLQQLKNRKIQSFNHTQHRRSRDIGHVNSLLYTKICYPSKSYRKKGVINNFSDSFELFQQKIYQRAEKLTQDKKQQKDHHFVLRNHRQSPIHKSTLLERTRENIRLAKKIVQPVITYRTSCFEKLQLNQRALKSRIMKYNPELAKTKAELYVEKRLNIFSRKASLSSKIDQSDLFRKTSLQRKNPQLNSKKIVNHSLNNLESNQIREK